MNKITSLFKKYKFKALILFIVVASIASYSSVDEYFEVAKNLDIFSTAFRELNIYYVDSVQPGKLMKKNSDARGSESEERSLLRNVEQRHWIHPSERFYRGCR